MAEFSVRASLLRDGDVTSGNPVSGGQPVGRLPDDRHVAVPRPAGGRREQSRLAETAEDAAQVPGEGVEPGQSAEWGPGQSAAASCSRDGGTGDHPEEVRTCATCWTLYNSMQTQSSAINEMFCFCHRTDCYERIWC